MQASTSREGTRKDGSAIVSPARAARVGSAAGRPGQPLQETDSTLL